MNREYNADDGLKILNYLGLTNLTEQEIQTFREKWPDFYKCKDVIGATWRLYAEALPFICGDGDRGSFIVAQLRDSDFGRRLETTKLDDRLRQGNDLDTICRKIPRRLIPSLGINMANEIYENGIREYRIFNGYRYYDRDNKVRQVDKISMDRIFILYNAISLNLIELAGYGLKNGR